MRVQTQPNSQSPLQKSNAGNSCQKARKIRYIFEFLPNFIVSPYPVPNILCRIEVDLFSMFTQVIQIFMLHYLILKKTRCLNKVIRQRPLPYLRHSRNARNKFYGIMGLVFGLTQKHTSSQRLKRMPVKRRFHLFCRNTLVLFKIALRLRE